MKWNMHAFSRHQSYSGGQLCSHGQVSLNGLDGLYPCTFFSACWRMMLFRQFSLFGTVFSIRRMPLQMTVSSIFLRSTIRPSPVP